ncbi:serine hydrolase domain-containing protein [Tunicatimonas pelagia]|uniref:serine hydrolase domain-containing protein n=1 Tax=Tunicatimonas pelagia TaxID=931531 RepID=UPI00266682B9|nr:serine hydrolase domain-containing protein [Tunicatimonas pelagia]WKN40650.1 serine hydrolase [Tunicatimonas pelagia]
MRARIRSLFLLICILLTVACQSSESPSVETTLVDSVSAVSSSYIPPAFQDDKRKEQLQSIAPRLKELMQQHADDRHISGVAWGIVVDDELVVADAYGLANREENIPATTSSVFRIASMTKSFTAMAILKLRDEGKLSLHDPVTEHIPEAKNLEYLTSDAPVMAIENLLTMTAGFPEDNPWGDRQLDEPEQMLLNLLQQTPAFSNVPAYEYEYSNTGYAMLGLIVQRVSGQPFGEYIRDNIFQPLGMNDTYWEVDRVPDDKLVIGYRWADNEHKLEPMLHHGIYGAMGGLLTTIEDFRKYVSFHLSAWPPRSEEDDGPVKRSTLREMHTPQYARLIAEAIDWNGETCPAMVGYGYGLGILENCKGTVQVSHGGALPGFGSNYKFYPELGIGFMAFGNRTYTAPWPWEEILKLVFNEFDLQPRVLPVSETLVERKEDVVNLIQDWDEQTEEGLIAENFYLDRSKEKRKAEAVNLLDSAGTIQSVTELTPQNQLRGSFKIQGEKGDIQVFFTLSPESDARLQALWLDFERNSEN